MTHHETLQTNLTKLKNELHEIEVIIVQLADQISKDRIPELRLVYSLTSNLTSVRLT